MTSLLSRIALGLAITAIPLVAVGCGSTSTPNPPAPKNGSVAMTMSDASTADWATIGVKVTAITLTPAVGTTKVTAYTAPSPAPIVNLVQLDQLSELLGNATVPAGTYTAATLTISANPGDVLLTAAADPTPGFEGTAGATVPSGEIQIMGATGAVGSLTVPVSVTFVSPLVVTATNTNALDLEFNLAHPAFLVPHTPQIGAIIWAVNFNGPVRHHPVANIAALVLRHIYGTATAVSTDDTSLTMTKDFALEPPVSPETAIASTQSLTILADDTNGTILYDVDAQTTATIMDFSTIASTLDGKFVRVAARYQSDGTLVAVRMWVSTLFNSVWLSPEGHVLHVDTIGDVLTVQDELGVGIPLTVNADTQYFFRTPGDAVADATAIGTGTAFLSNLVRGFKVHASAVNPLAGSLVAQEIDIEIARYDGVISDATGADFLDTTTFNTGADDYSLALPYISGSTANGTDPLTGTAITGFKWWNLTFPTTVNSGATAITTFEAADAGLANVGGTVGSIPVAGQSFATWNDPIAPDDWAVPFTVLTPSPLPIGSIVTGYAAGTFTMAVQGGAINLPVGLSTTVGSATLVYQVDRTANVVTITPVDITTTGGVTTITTDLVTGTLVKVFGVPQADGSIKAYVVFFYTGTLPGEPI
jgi:Domain of unknown function (DUF4382)